MASSIPAMNTITAILENGLQKNDPSRFIQRISRIDKQQGSEGDGAASQACRAERHDQRPGNQQ